MAGARGNEVLDRDLGREQHVGLPAGTLLFPQRSCSRCVGEASPTSYKSATVARRPKYSQPMHENEITGAFSGPVIAVATTCCVRPSKCNTISGVGHPCSSGTSANAGKRLHCRISLLPFSRTSLDPNVLGPGAHHWILGRMCLGWRDRSKSVSKIRDTGFCLSLEKNI